MAVTNRVLAALLFCSAVATARAQNPVPPDVIIPPPPRIKGGAGQPDHQPQLAEPGKAYDFVTQRRYTWSCGNQTWIDDATGQAVGYDGYKAQNGEIIPPPRRDLLTNIQAVQSATDPTRATDPRTGTELRWDFAKHEWKNPKNGQSVFPQGWVMKICPEKGKSLTQVGREDALFQIAQEERGSPVELRLDVEYRNFLNWKEVLDSVPGAAATDGSSSAFGVGLSGGYRPFAIPIYIGGDVYCVGGLNADITLANGRELKSKVTDCGAGFGFRYYPLVRKVQPYIAVGLMWEHNSNNYKEYNGGGDRVFSETRTLSSWSGLYKGGLVYWPIREVGIDFGVGYQGRFKNMNADENIRLSTGLVLRLGQR